MKIYNFTWGPHNLVYRNTVMKYNQKRNISLLFYFFSIIIPLYANEATEIESASPQRINQIIITGNTHISDSAILNYVPYKIGQVFDPIYTRETINNIYFGLKRFKNISIAIESIDEELLDLHIIVEEKNPLRNIIIDGNKHLSEKNILEKTGIQDMPAIDENDMQIVAKKIQDLYLQKGYHATDIETEIVIIDGCADALFNVCEGPRAVVKRIYFKGNECVTDKELRNIVLTKEEWLLSFLDRAGQYHPERLKADKHFLEKYYKDKKGRPNAKVIDTDVCINEKNEITLTFEIEEGEQYTIGQVNVTGNDICNEAYLRTQIPLFPGMIYSQEAIAASIKRLEFVWGNFGYIFAHVEPAIDVNDENKTISVTFFSEIGNKANLRYLTICGNEKTRYKIIRRKLLVCEGQPLNQLQMDLSQRNVEALGYFKPQEGVLWKLKRVNNEKIDLDLIVQEAHTGHFGAQFGFGGAGADMRSPASGLNATIELSDTNLFGSGIHLNTSASWSKDEQTLLFHIAQPWLFDKPILGAFDIYHKRPTYDELRNLDIRAVHEKLTGGSATIGYITHSNHQLIHDVHIVGSIGIDNSNYQQLPKAQIFGVSPETNAEYQSILDKEFNPGKFVWLSTKVEHDTRNHPMHTSRGHHWRVIGKFALPSFGDKISFYKLNFDWSWFTPLINEYDLVLRMHAYGGITAPFKNRTVPFGELFHIGGPNSVRGFLFGQIGPKFQGDTIGGKKALFWNIELVFPIAGDLSMKGVIFYDGGAGFDNPYAKLASPENITNNNFDYRHSIGFGLRLLRPMPIKIDWGFKIDPRKNKLDPRRSETSHEVHFGMSYDW